MPSSASLLLLSSLIFLTPPVLSAILEYRDFPLGADHYQCAIASVRVVRPFREVIPKRRGVVGSDLEMGLFVLPLAEVQVFSKFVNEDDGPSLDLVFENPRFPLEDPYDHSTKYI